MFAFATFARLKGNQHWLRPQFRGAHTHRDEKGANRHVRDSGCEIAHAADLRRPPNSLDTIVARTRTPRKFGICPSFKGHFLSPRAKPYISIRDFCIAVSQSRC
jgi:hypothetical protein